MAEKGVEVAARQELVRQAPVDVTAENLEQVVHDNIPEFSRFRLSGDVVPDAAFLGPRTCPVKDPPQKSLPLAGDVRSGGSLVIVPVRLASQPRALPGAAAAAGEDSRSAGPVVLLNLGWVANDRRSMLLDQIRNAPISLLHADVVLRRGEKRNQYTPDNDPQRQQWYWVDPAGLAAHFGVSARPTFLFEAVDAGGGRTPGAQLTFMRKPEDFAVFPVMPDMHLVYAGTWLALSVGLTAVAFLRLR